MVRLSAFLVNEAVAMSRDRRVGQAKLYPLNGLEYAGNTDPRHTTFQCGHCATTTNGRIVCDVLTHEGITLQMCLCSCEKTLPTLLVEHGGQILRQVPRPCEFSSHEKWPVELSKLYDEAAKCMAAGAFTAASMLCRKVLMACACHEGDDDGKNFGPYVDYITGKVLTYPRAKAAIDAIRTIGNDANHQLQFVTEDDAKRSMQIVTYMLDAIYSFPAAWPAHRGGLFRAR
jgi:hypothetical protein